MIFVTGGAGFIGANFVLQFLAKSSECVVNLDKLTYAGNRNSLQGAAGYRNHVFLQCDICDTDRIMQLLDEHHPRAIVHFAAESHVDRSILGPADFISTNINGTFSLLEAARRYWSRLPSRHQDKFRFVHVSTDEVYGALGPDDAPFSELTPYAPNSPYSASKAAADHLVRAYHHTYGLPTVTTNCSNNYGPFQFPEKLVPLVITRALAGDEIPIYGDGEQVRDWLYVRDHCAAVWLALEAGQAGETYNIGGRSERTNLTVVNALCETLDDMAPAKSGLSYKEQIVFVRDRPGHDRRYAIDAGKIERELGWTPSESFESGICKTVAWYLANQAWVRDVQSGAYRQWLMDNYAHRTKLEEAI